MSRCFPYPPPGYLLSRDREEALIESIKLQEEKQKKKEEKRKKKERRRERKEKKEKRKERRERRKHKKHQNLDKSDHKISSDKTEILHKRGEAEAEAERSSLTEEHGDHVSLSGPTYSSDRTQNSNKRKRHSSPESHSQSQVILIRMPSKKQNEFDTVAKEQQACSTSGRTDDDMSNIPSTSTGKTGIKPILNKVMSSTSGRTDNEMGNNQSTLKGKNVIKPVSNGVITSTSGRTVNNNNMGNNPSTSKGKNGINPDTNGVVSSMQRMEMQYKNLLDKLVPQVLQDESLYSDNLDWLFKNQDSQAEKRQRSGSESVSSCSRSSAEFLRETGVFVLPYTVPY